MKALSIRQPWAYLIVNGYKDIENRSWPTSFRGEVLIHAANGMTKNEYEDCRETVTAINRLIKYPILLPEFPHLERGGIIGKAEITDCVHDHDSLWFFGKFGFVIKNAQPLTFTPYKGRLGFFEVKE